MKISSDLPRSDGVRSTGGRGELDESTDHQPSVAAGSRFVGEGGLADGLPMSSEYRTEMGHRPGRVLAGAAPSIVTWGHRD